MNKRTWLIGTAIAVLPVLVRASTIDALVADIAGSDEKARIEARQLLPRESIDAVPKLLPLLKSDNEVVWRTAFNILADFANRVSVPGREAERAKVASEMMALVAAEQPERIKLLGLKLLPIVTPAGYDVGPVSAMLSDEKLQEKARAALVEMGTPEARAALREALAKADPDFQCALLDGLAQLTDAASLATIEPLAKSDNAKVRAAAARALAWTGKPDYLSTIKTVVASADPATMSDAKDAYLRVLNAIAENGGDSKALVNAYLELLKSDSNLDRDAALGALGRMGDASCVDPILAAIKDRDNPTRANGIAALRIMQGVDVTRAIVAAYPNASREIQLALLPVLGGKKDALAVPVLLPAAKSEDTAFRVAALTALGEAGQPEGLEPLLAAAKSGGDEEKAAAGKALMPLADALKAGGRKAEAGKAYLAALERAGDIEGRRQALAGIAECPLAAAYEAVKTTAADKELHDQAVSALTRVGAVLAATGEKDKALEAYQTARDLKPSPAALPEVLKGLHALGVKVDLPSLLGVITNWSVVGPFDLGQQQEGWKKNYVNEPKVDLSARYMAGKRRLDWKPVISTDPNGKVDLRKAVADTDAAIGYAYAEITVREAGDAILLIGSDDSSKVWVNGKKVLDQMAPRALVVDQDRIPIKLKAGKNTILLKIWQNNMGWEFCARITKPDGQALSFTQTH